MASLFREIHADARAALADTFGEPVTLRARITGNYSDKPDPSRPDQALTAIVSRLTGTEPVSDRRGGEGTMSRLALAKPEALVPAAGWEALAWAPRRGDHLVAEDGETFAIGTLLPDPGGMRIMLEPR